MTPHRESHAQIPEGMKPEHIKSVEDAFMALAHPAFRLGFLDAQHGRPFDHDAILLRIERETDARALKRLEWWPAASTDVELAQFRYEEGRLLQRMYGLKCRSWSWPSSPPSAVMTWALERFAKTQANAVRRGGGV